MPCNADFCALEPTESLIYCPLLRKHSKFFPILGFLQVFFRDLEHSSAAVFKSCLFIGSGPNLNITLRLRLLTKNQNNSFPSFRPSIFTINISTLLPLQNSRICRLYNVLSLVFHSRCILWKQTLLFSLFIIVYSSVLFIGQVSVHIFKMN